MVNTTNSKKDKKKDDAILANVNVDKFYNKSERHLQCIPPEKMMPPEMGWNYKDGSERCCKSEILLPENYKPGAAMADVAKKVKKDRKKLMCPKEIAKKIKKREDKKMKNYKLRT